MMGLVKYSFEQLRMESYGLDYEAVLAARKAQPKLVPRKTTDSVIETKCLKRLDEYYHEWTHSPEFADEMRENQLSGNDREY